MRAYSELKEGSLPSAPRRARSPRFCIAMLCVAFGLAACFTTPASASPLLPWTIEAIGFTDAEHTRDDGYRISSASQLNEAGHVRGQSYRYSGSTGLGQTAWLYNGTTTINIGLVGPEYTRSNGDRDSNTLQLNEAGHVRGYSRRIITDGGSWFSSVNEAWLYNGTSTINVGLTNPEHTHSDGYRGSGSQQLNAAGQVTGGSDRYSGSTWLGQSAWLYNGTTTINIGLTDAGHTRSTDGWRSSQSQQLNEAGQVSGVSDRYSGATYQGNTAWLYKGTSTINIGLTTAEHTRNDGYRYSEISQLNQAGQVRGHSSRYSGSTGLGLTAWLYNGTSTVNIGLTNSEHTRTDGYRYSYTSQLNEAGQVRGHSSRYSGSTGLGLTAWLYDGTNTVNIGLTDPGHTRNDGYRNSESQQLNEAGHVRGYSRRYSGSTDLGSSAWLYDGTSTINIGLTDAVHTRNDGYRDSRTNQLNEAGQVRGYSTRFSGAAEHGQTGWVYDPVLDTTVAMLLSTRADGYAVSGVTTLRENGVALGYYRLYDGMDSLGNRAFYWSREDGLWDLGSLVHGGLAANGWDFLGNASQANTIGQVIGYGRLDDMPSGQMAYLLTPMAAPAAPELFVQFGRLGSDDRLPAATVLTVVPGGTFDLDGHNQTLGSLASDGTVMLGSGTLTVGGDVTVLGPLTALGNGTAGGVLTAGNAQSSDNYSHFLLEQGKNLVGRGEINGHFKNHGDAIGDGTDAGDRLVFNSPWTVSGKGTFTNTMVLGTFAPGDSPAIIWGENQGFGGTVEIELGGLTPGFGNDNHDQINDTGTILLLGEPELAIRPWDDFVPSMGDQFVVMTWAEGLTGTFGSVTVDPWFLSHGILFSTTYVNPTGAGSLILTAAPVPEPGTALLLLIGAWIALPLRRRNQR